MSRYTTDKVRKWRREHIQQVRAAWFADNGPCVVCGTWERLELDHVDPSTKVAHQVWTWAPERRASELSKCQVLCHACHLLKTSAERYVRAEHGQMTRYRYGCRCAACRQANAERVRQQRAR